MPPIVRRVISQNHTHRQHGLDGLDRDCANREYPSESYRLSAVRVRFWIVIGALVVGFFATAAWILNRVASPPVTTVVSRPQLEWRRFGSKKDRFSIAFPS